jgi:hypothetical protein
MPAARGGVVGGSAVGAGARPKSQARGARVTSDHACRFALESDRLVADADAERRPPRRLLALLLVERSARNRAAVCHA